MSTNRLTMRLMLQFILVIPVLLLLTKYLPWGFDATLPYIAVLSLATFIAWFWLVLYKPQGNQPRSLTIWDWLVLGGLVLLAGWQFISYDFWFAVLGTEGALGLVWLGVIAAYWWVFSRLFIFRIQDIQPTIKLHWLTFGLCLLVLVMAYFLAISPLLSYQQILAGEKRALNEDYNQATLHIEKALRLAPLVAPELLLHAGEFVDESVPTSSEVALAKTHIEFLINQIENRVVPKSNRSVRTWLVVGDLYSKLGYLESSALVKANQAFERATQIAPDSAQVWLRWGQTEFIQGNYDDAQTHLNQALALDPRLAEAQALNVVVQMHLGDFERAAVLVDEALASDSSLIADARYTSLIIGAARSQNRVQFAIEQLAKILAVYPTADLVRSQLAELYKSVGQIADARREATYIMENSTNPNARMAAKNFLDSL